jgi:hypothetical protein
MKNIIIVGAYPNTPTKEKMVYDCISQLKKTGNDILLVSNYPKISDRVLELCNLYVHTDDNLLLSVAESPTCWYANHVDFIETFGTGITYIVVKKLKLAMTIANTMKYDNFMYLECDNIISDQDIPQVEKLFSMTENHIGVFFRFSRDGVPISDTNPLGYETMIFAGNVKFFAEEINFPISYEEWLSNPMWTHGHHALEFKFPSLFVGREKDIKVMMEHKSGTFFPTSRLDLSHCAKSVHVIQNIDNPTNPLLLVVGDDVNISVRINTDVVLDEVLPKNEWKTFYFDITDEVTVETVVKNTTERYTLNKNNIESYSTGIRRNIV